MFLGILTYSIFRDRGVFKVDSVCGSSLILESFLNEHVYRRACLKRLDC